MTTKEEDEDDEEEDQEEKKTKSERLLTEALRKMAIDRRESVTARCLRRGMFSEHSYSSLKQRQQQQQQHALQKFFLLFLQIVFTPRRESDRDDSNAETNQSRGVLRDRDLERVLCVTNLARRS